MHTLTAGDFSITLGNTVYGTLSADAIQLIPLTTTTALNYIHADHLGTPIFLTNQAQEKVWEARYTPFGEAEISNETVENNLRFAGQYYDGETGLHYNWFRYYDPSIGRYTQSDPIGLRGGFNTYLYVDANPLIYIDPDGLEKLDLLGTSGGLQGIKDAHMSNIFAKMPDKDGVLMIMGHSDGKTIKDGRFSPVERLEPSKLADTILKSGLWKEGMSVELLACSTGEGGDGSFASDLSELLNSPVTAPDTLIWPRASGDHKLCRLLWLLDLEPAFQNGSMRTFNSGQ